MEKDQEVYEDLQKHLDRQAVGFPATKSGARKKDYRENPVNLQS